MSKILYNPGDKVIVHDASGPIAKYCADGDILTIKRKMRDRYNTYYVEEFKSCIAGYRFTLFYNPNEDGLYNEWPNRETQDVCRIVDRNPSHPSDDSPMEIKTIMKIETKHYVNDIDITTMTIDQKVALIKKTEDQIDELKKVKTESQMIRNEIAKLSKFLIDAVVLFDEN